MDDERQKQEDERRRKAEEEEERLAQQVRQGANRLVGLGSYAMGILILVFVGCGFYENPAAARKDFKTDGLFVIAALACFAIGYTTERKNKK